MIDHGKHWMIGHVRVRATWRPPRLTASELIMSLPVAVQCELFFLVFFQLTIFYSILLTWFFFLISFCLIFAIDWFWFEFYSQFILVISAISTIYYHLLSDEWSLVLSRSAPVTRCSGRSLCTHISFERYGRVVYHLGCFGLVSSCIDARQIYRQFLGVRAAATDNLQPGSEIYAPQPPRPFF